MAGPRKLNKALWTNITRLKLLTKSDAPVQFILEDSPFDDEQEEETAIEKDVYFVRGRILPESDIFKEGALRIEMRLTSNYPNEAPEVRFLTPIYHPNISADGKFCHQLLNNASRWKAGTTLVEVVKTIVKHVDNPDPDYAAIYGIVIFLFYRTKKKCNATIIDLRIEEKTNFQLEQSPFAEDDDESESSAAATQKEVVVTGRIFPDSDIYNQGSFKIEMKILNSFPFDPPEVRFLTPIYHPLVGQDGKFCNELLQKHAKWSNKISLPDVVKAVVKHIDDPNIDYALSNSAVNTRKIELNSIVKLLNMSRNMLYLFLLCDTPQQFVLY
ncbi:unnamed protein product [Rotaria magnacalcarata]